MIGRRIARARVETINATSEAEDPQLKLNI
jgi:hypothetical protein